MNVWPPEREGERGAEHDCNPGGGRPDERSFHSREVGRRAMGSHPRKPKSPFHKPCQLFVQRQLLGRQRGQVEHREDAVGVHRQSLASSARTASGWPGVFTPSHTLRMMPDASISTVVRTTPTLGLPYMSLSRQML